ncbi:hypothetical protein BDY24DRAFT_43881 [Mrakia frigida]|uniref:uncharacterized protein n=1 Tax=Mrakia frigida TaxID=29902 RepID=UPI003FCC0BD1
MSLSFKATYPLVFVLLSFDSLLSSFPSFFACARLNRILTPTPHTHSLFLHTFANVFLRGIWFSRRQRGETGGRDRRVVVFFPLRDSGLPSWLFQWLED